MALKLNKPHQSKTASAISSGTNAKASPSGGLAFIKRGAAAQAEMAKADHKAEMAQANNIFRYWIPKDGDGAITFLDGDVADDMLSIPFLYEHNINMNGKWNNFFICTQDTEPCPVCEGGNSPAYVGLLSVIDHSSYTSKKTNKTYVDTVKLFVAKRDTIKQLTKLAVKRGGLAGCRFDVSRTGDKSPGVGNIFDFTEKMPMDHLAKQYPEAKPVDYVEYLKSIYMEAKDLRKMGFGSLTGPIGSESGVADSTDYSDSL